jgi:hypothetical protein
MIKSESIKELLTALAKAQGKISAAKKDSTNPHFKSKYADLASCWEAIKEPLSTNGLSLTQWVSPSERGVSITTFLGHSSGEWLSSEATFPVKDAGNPQSMGSSITYARRYCLSAAIGLVADEDDDGNAASQAKPSPERQITRAPSTLPTAKKPELISKAQYQILVDLAQRLGMNEQKMIEGAGKGKENPEDWDLTFFASMRLRLETAILKRMEQEKAAKEAEEVKA